MFVFEIDNGWCEVEYLLGENSEVAYIHRSGLIFLTELENLSIFQTGDSIAECRHKSFRFYAKIGSFDAIPHVNSWNFDDHNSPWIEMIDSALVLGTDCQMPTSEYKELYIELGSRRIDLPRQNLFEPSFQHLEIRFHKKTSAILLPQ